MSTASDNQNHGWGPGPRDDPSAPLPPPARLLRWLFFLLVMRPLALIVLGMNVRHRHRLPMQGPALVVANHNSHLDALVMMILWPLSKLHRIRPVAAADYFFRFRALKWFALRIIGIVPINRQLKGMRMDPLARVTQAVERGEIVILFPEGQRGEPEKLEEFKTCIAHLARRHPQVPVYPVYMHGLGKALPRGEALLVPFFCDVFIGEPMTWSGDKELYMTELNARMKNLADEGHFPAWE
jgi:1-acyl-sn-glycerol-3-phosphate acyltransferase